MPTPTSPRRLPPLLIVVLAGLALEVVALVVAGGAAVVDLVAGTGRVGVGLFLAAFAWGLAAVLVACARSLVAGHRGARSPVITWQLFQLVIAGTWLQESVSVPPLLLGGVAVAVLVGMLTPAVVEATTRSARPAVDDDAV